MRYSIIALITTALIAILSACSVESKPDGGIKVEPSTAVIGTGMKAFATLASSGTFEMELAPSYTRLAQIRYNATSLLEQYRITVDQAIEIQNSADEVRTVLDYARQLDANKNATGAKTASNKAKSLLNTLEAKL
jgi:hypothetical protein